VCVNEGGTYEAEVGQDERVLEVGKRVRREDSWVRLGGRGDHDGIRTSYRAYSTRIFEANTIAVLDDRDITTEALDKVDDLLEAVDEGTLAGPHVARAAVDREAADARVDDALYEGERVLLRRKKADLCGDRDTSGELAPEGGEDGAKEVRVRQKGGTHSRMGREGLRATAVKLDSGDIVYDQARGLHSKVRIGRANLEYKVGFLDRMTSKHGTLMFAVIRNGPRYS
jgi:hypothetical protein